MKIKELFCSVMGLAGSFITGIFGGWDNGLMTLVIFMIIDYISGIVVAAVFGNSKKTKSGALESKAGWKGLCKKGMTFLFVLIAHRLDMALKLDFIRTATIIGFIANELISIVENAGLMGIPLPKAINNAIEILKNIGDEEKLT